MDMIERIEHKEELFAIIIRGEYECNGTKFVTSKESPLQVGLIGRKKGENIQPHIHKPVTRTIEYTQEFIHITKGRVVVDFYDVDGSKIKSATLKSGDSILLTGGGHGFQMLEDTRMIEVKQGPYLSVESDKQHLEEKK